MFAFGTGSQEEPPLCISPPRAGERLLNPVGSNRFETSSHTPFYTNSCYCHCILADRTLWIPAFAGITMALRRPHKGMETGWRRERATTRVAPTTGLPEPIFRGMTVALRRPHKGMETGWRRERATTRVAPTTGLPEPIFRGITMALRRPHKGMETGWRRNGQPQGLPLQQVCRSLFSEE